MPKTTSVYVCQQCGYKSSQYLGKCPQCDSWNSMVEQIEETQKSKVKSQKYGSPDRAEIIDLANIQKSDYKRLDTGFEEFNRVLGGGIVLGSVVLVAGDPGIGKSTLLTQLALNISENSENQRVRGSDDQKIRRPDQSDAPTHRYSGTQSLSESFRTVLYVAGEESARQIKIRVDRIKPNASISVLNETDVDVICETIEELSVLSGQLSDSGQSVSQLAGQPNTGKPGTENRKPRTDNWKGLSLVIIDSIQTLETADLASVAGSVGQVRECSHRLQKLAKGLHIPIFLVGHVTKEGNLAGPKTLEHVVDVVLSLEGEPNSNFRILRTSKNRFGPTDEVGIFEMTDIGMAEVNDPSRIFLDRKINAPGSAVVAALTGVRPLMVEIQALVTKSFLPMPRRVGSGIDNNRLQLLIAVLMKRLGLPLFDKDIFVNVTGGLRVFEPASDLGICLAIISSVKDKTIKEKTVFAGEVGLLGELRAVRNLEKRVSEAKKLGFTNIISSQNAKSLAQAMKLALI